MITSNPHIAPNNSAIRSVDVGVDECIRLGFKSEPAIKCRWLASQLQTRCCRPLVNEDAMECVPLANFEQ